MADDHKLVDLPELTAPADADKVLAVDTSDTTDAASGSTKWISLSRIATYLASLAQTLSNKILTAPQINDTSADHQYIVGVNELTADRTVTLPLLTGDDEFVFKDHFQTLTNKVWNDWKPYSTVVPTRGTADDPTYPLVFAGVDLTSIISVGMRVKWTQNSIVRYGIVTAIAFSTNTTIQVLTICNDASANYDVLDTSTYPITAFNYSPLKAPLGFPLDPSKWTVEVTDTTQRSQATPTTNQWYNLGSISIDIPIGVWNVEYNVCMGGRSTSATGTFAGNFQCALSTANNSASDADLTAANQIQAYASSSSIDLMTPIYRRKILVLASKTAYYQNVRQTVGGVTFIIAFNDLHKNIIRAISAYL